MGGAEQLVDRSYAVRVPEELEVAEAEVVRRRRDERLELTDLPDGTHVVIDASNCVSIAYDVNEIIDDFKRSAPERDITSRSVADCVCSLQRDRTTGSSSPRRERNVPTVERAA